MIQTNIRQQKASGIMKPASSNKVPNDTGSTYDMLSNDCNKTGEHT